jgi:hypothetical protein
VGVGLRTFLFPAEGKLQMIYVFSLLALAAFALLLFMTVSWLVAYISSGSSEEWTAQETLQSMKWLTGCGLMLMGVSIFWQPQGMERAIFTAGLFLALVAGILWFRKKARSP